MTKQLRKIIKEMGIHPEDEHYDVAEEVVRQCAAMARNLSPMGKDAERLVLEEFGLELE
jgi:hypothetical protein